MKLSIHLLLSVALLTVAAVVSDRMSTSGHDQRILLKQANTLQSLTGAPTD